MPTPLSMQVSPDVKSYNCQSSNNESTTMTDFNEAEYIEVKDLYQAVTGDRSWDARWSEYKDPGEENTKLQPYRSSFPIVHKWTCTNIEDGTWETKAVEVNDKRLRALVEGLLADVPNMSFDDEVLKFDSPFQPFLFKWREFNNALDTETDAKLRNLLQHLHDIVSPAVEPVLHKVKRAKATQSIDWNLLVDCCVPGELILGTFQKRQQAYKVTGSGTDWDDLDRRYLWLDVDYHDWDGIRSGTRSTRFRVIQFKGEKPLKSLQFVPFQFLRNLDDIKEELIERGKVFESMVGYSFRHYNGIKIMPDHSSQISSRVVIDAFAYHTFFGQKWIGEPRADAAELSEDESEIEVDTPEDTQEGSNVRREVRKRFTEEDYLLSIPTVKGFDLENRQWAEFYIDSFRDIVWNESAYDKLVLDENEKKMIFAFSEQVRDANGRSDDFIKNKGRGVLMLLCGPPGVGKTLTAESVAERAHLPLYAVNAGEVGSKADTADETLKTILECCRLWNAVLLLDEADVFLEARGTDSLVRNELVSVFLRRLEYFGGLMFLTTNRPRSLDPAFESRLDLIIPYADLDASARKTIWKTFVNPDNITPSKFEEHNFDALSRHKCNGREIKNIVKIARMLAVQDNAGLSMGHIETVLKLRIKAAKALGNNQFE